ncbi:immune inhibitor A [Streptomyces sp. NBC_00287]|uniref:immune inhibitor A domain-containing protein n=1 Tax=Streptomyces sp. NBC_00287 TaxID=2975702 RepID=UPI002E2C5074|nr:immune inhibitor A domain-containing protein [Streptomyces sp. NBC_00287]
MALSTRGIARHYLGVTGHINTRSTILGGAAAGTVSLRNRLVTLARREFTFALSECIYSSTAAFEQTWSSIRVRIQLNPDAGITAATMNGLRTTWENGIETTWGNRWALGRTGEGACPLEFEVQWVTASPHHTVRVQTGPARSNVTTWDTADTGGVAAHEFGHMLGHPDEYTDSNCPTRNPVNTGTVMDNNSANVPQRLMTRFADNVGSSVVAI